MSEKSWNIRMLEGGFVVETYNSVPPPPGQENIGIGVQRRERIFADSGALLNYLHNELIGSN